MVLPVGSLRLSDLGYFNVSVWQQFDADGSFILTRIPANVVVVTPTGDRIAYLPGWLAAQATSAGTVDVSVLSRVQERLPARLLAERVPAPIAVV